MTKTTHEIKKIPDDINNLKELWYSESEVLAIFDKIEKEVVKCRGEYFAREYNFTNIKHKTLGEK
jgi:hypothetical protein